MKLRMVLTFFIVLGFALPAIPGRFPVPARWQGLLGTVSAAATVQPVSWTNIVNSKFDGISLSKTSGVDGVCDAGANSVQQIVSGDGYAEFTALETGKDRYLGLTNNFAGTYDSTIDYAVHLTRTALRTGYVAEILEKGRYKTETTYTSKTVFRISVENKIVKFYKNGTLIYSSGVAPIYPMTVKASLRNLSATVANAVIASGSTTPVVTPSTADTTPPVISQVAATPVSSSQAAITWATNEQATTQVDYGMTSAYGSTVTVNTLSLAHQVNLIGLPAGVTCHYRVVSKDGANNMAASGDLLVTTPAVIVTPTPTPTPASTDTTPPTLSGVSSVGITSYAATINWVSNEASTSVVEYGTTSGYGNTTTITTLVSNHAINLIGLQPNTTYNYRVKSADAAGNLATSANATFSTTPLATIGSSPGMLDDKLAHVPTNYTGFVPPAVGGSYVDPVFGTTITRLSNGPAQFGQAVHHEYATMSPFNKDNTRILLVTENSGFYVVDLAGNIIVTPDQLQIGGLGEPRWSTTDPNLIYFHDFGTNKLQKYDLSTRQKSIVRTFTQFSSIDFGGGESDISEDGNHMVIVGDKRYVGVYTFSTDTLSATLDTGGRSYDYFDMTANNNVIVRWGAQGTARYSGFEVFNGNMNFLRQVYPYGAHADRGRDLNGDEVLVVLAATDLAPAAGCEGNGIEKVRLSDGRKTCLVALNWDVGTHVSANTNGANPWVLIEATDEHSNTQVANGSLPSDWQSRWRSYYNELILVKIDGSEVRRIGHHRSRSLDSYWFTPRAALSRDGAYAIFDSNFASYPVSAYTDAYLVKLK